MANALLLSLIAAVSPVSAVQFGQPDGTAHPYVGLVVFYDSAMVPSHRCTGSLISSTVLLTAGHCAAGTPRAQVWFDPGPIPRDPAWSPGVSCLGPFTGYPCAGGYLGTPTAHPGFTGALTLPNTHDVGVVVLDAPLVVASYGQLATANYLNILSTKRGLQNVQFTVVGYGLQSVIPVTSGIRERFTGTVHLINLRSALTDGFNVQFTNDPGLGTGSGGVCFGDSGGPVLHTNSQGQQVIVAVNSFVLNQNCMGSAFSYRVDISDSRSFLGVYVPLP